MKLCKECKVNERAPQRSRCYSCYGKARRGSPKPCYTTPSDMKLLFIDCETRPNLVWAWGLWQQNVGINQIKESGEVICFSAKWMGDMGGIGDSDGTMFFSARDQESKLKMIDALWKLLDECDVVCHYYGKHFDVPWFNSMFVLNGYPPPSPYKQLDLKNVSSKVFKFPSNKLQYVSTALGLEGKMDHEGFDLWRLCMEGDNDAWSRMEAYNRQDVILLESVYEILLPWIPSAPNRRLYDGEHGCPACGNDTLVEAGIAYTKVSSFNQMRCTACGGLFRYGKRISGVGLQESVL